jgi:glycosyltransferase involved in cell wall biosynthesis
MDLLEGSKIKVKYLTNYNNPLSWYETYRYILNLKPDKVVFQWAIAIQGLPIGRIVSWLRQHSEIEVILDLHFVIQKENSSIDKIFTKLGIGKANTYIVHALKTYNELKTLYPQRSFELSYEGQRSADKKVQTVLKLYHPIYDLFQTKADFDVAAFKKQYGLREHVFLFFGFIRKYKGLHYVIPAFQKVAAQRDDVSLLICGESFWQTLDNSKPSTKIKNTLFGLAKKIVLRQNDDERDYKPLALIDELKLQDRVAVFNHFIPNEEVHRYFQVADCVVLFYEYATPSGIESLSYNFALPLVATRVGHFPETIQEGFSGYLAEPGDVDSMAAQLLRFLDQPIPRENIRAKTAELSWENYAKAIIHT